MMKEKQMWKYKDKVKKEMKDKQELEECTFKPKVKDYPLKNKIGKYTTVVKSRLGCRTARA